MCLLRAPTNTAVFIRNRANVRLDVPVGDRSRAYLQLSFRVDYRWLFARARGGCLWKRRYLRSRFLAGEALFAASTPPWTPPLFKLEGALGERAFDDDFVLGSPSLVLARRAFFSSPPTAPALPHPNNNRLNSLFSLRSSLFLMC